MKGSFCVLVLAAGVALSAQQPARPTFKTGVNAVVMDVRVIDIDGRFITDLTRDDFQVFEDGREQSIATFELVNLPAPRPSPIAAPLPQSDVSSNEGFDDGRLYVFVLDDLYGHALQVMPDIRFDEPGLPSEALPPSALARELILRMGDADRAAVVTTGGRRDMAQEFTNDRGRLLALVDRYVANQGQPLFNGKPDAIKSLMDVAHWLAGIEGRRKAIILISQRMSGVSGDLTLTNWSRNRGLQDLMTPYHIKNLIEATSRSNVTIYTLNPMIQTLANPFLARDLDSRGWFPEEYMQAVAETHRPPGVVTIAQATGGFTASGNFNGIFDRIVAEAGAYYLIGFTSSKSKDDGQFHRVEVRTRHPDLVARTRAGYVAAEPKALLKKSMVLKNAPIELTEALQSPVSMTGIPMSMAATPFRGSNGKPSLSILVEFGAMSPAQTAVATTPMQIAIAAARVDGMANEVRRIAVGGGTVVSTLAVKPGRYHVRVGALDTDTGRRGSLLYDIDVPAFGGDPLTMSGVTLGSSRDGDRLVSGADQRWKDQLGIPPTTRRVFSSDEVLHSHLEVYDNSRSDVSEVAAVLTIRDESREVRFTKRETSVVRRVKGKLAPHQIRARIPFEKLPPGSYVLYVETERADGSDPATARPIPFTVR